jgi:hypothetical protein
VLVSKDATTCQATCGAGPSCNKCDEPVDGAACLTRTRGFWGTHPHIITELVLLPITVCGKEQTQTASNYCSTSEALCTSADDRKANPTSLSLVAQLTAAKLNLKATAKVAEGATCSDYESTIFTDKTIQEIIAYCEANYCSGNKNQISASRCIEALDEFNRSGDTGFETDPEPFNRPGPAQVAECQAARGNGISNYNCTPAP